MGATEKVAYLKGLMDGLDLDKDKKTTKVFTAIADVLDELAVDIMEMKEESSILFDAVETIDDDLRSIEELFDEDDDDDDDDGCGCGGHHHGHHETIYETTCPACGEVINLDETLLSVGEIKCPSCGENLEFGFDDDEEEEIIAIETDKKTK